MPTLTVEFRDDLPTDATLDDRHSVTIATAPNVRMLRIALPLARSVVHAARDAGYLARIAIN